MPISLINNNKPKKKLPSKLDKAHHGRLWLLIILGILPVFMVFVLVDVELSNQLVLGLAWTVGAIHFVFLVLTIVFFFKLLYDHIMPDKKKIKKDKRYLLYCFLITISSMLVWFTFIFIS